MNIIGYVKKYGNQTFKELPFNDIDALIFSELSYLNFHLIGLKDSFRKINELNIKNKKKFYASSVDAFNNRRLFEAMIKSPRYQDMMVGKAQGKTNRRTNEQFYAITLIFPNGVRFISYRGTDISVAGWKEDLLIAFQDEIPSQKSAIKYLRMILKEYDGKYYLGGHSKGGNLAMYSALKIGKRREKKIIKVFSFDGPGFKKNIYALESYKRIEHKLEKYLTTHDVIGVIYNKNPNPKIVYSNGVLLVGHDLFYWTIKNNKPEFVFDKERSKISRDGEYALMSWLNSEDDESKSLAVKVVCDILGDTKTIYDILLNAGRILIKGIKTVGDYTEETKEKAKEIFKRLGKYYLHAYSPNRFLFSELSNKKKNHK